MANNNQKNNIPLGQVGVDPNIIPGVSPRVMAQDLVSTIKEQDGTRPVDITTSQIMQGAQDPSGLPSIGENLFRVQNILGKFFPEQVEPPVEPLGFDQLFPGLSQPTKAGVVTGQVIGTQPIFVPSGGVFPTGIVQARKRALGQAAAAKLKARKEFLDAVKPPKTAVQYTNFVNNQLFGGIREFLQETGGDPNKLETDIDLGLKYRQFLTNIDFLAQAGSDLDAQALKIIEDFSDPSKYVPFEAVELAKNIRKGWSPDRTPEEQGFNILTDDVEGAVNRMFALPSAGELLNQGYLQRIESQVRSWLGGVDTSKIKGVSLLKKFKKEFLTPERQKQIVENEWFMNKERWRALGVTDQKQLKKFMEPMWPEKLDLTVNAIRTEAIAGTGRAVRPDSFFIPQRQSITQFNKGTFDFLNRVKGEKRPLTAEDLVVIKENYKNSSIAGRKFLSEVNNIDKMTPKLRDRKTMIGNYSRIPGVLEKTANINLSNGLVFNKETGRLNRIEGDEFVQGKLIKIIDMPWGKSGQEGAYTVNEIISQPSRLGDSTDKIRLLYSIGKDLTPKEKDLVANFYEQGTLSDDEALNAFNQIAKRAGISDARKEEIVSFEFDLSNEFDRSQLDLLLGPAFIKSFFATGEGAVEAPQEDLDADFTTDEGGISINKTSTIFE